MVSREGLEWEDVKEQLPAPSTMDWVAEEAERTSALLPGTEA
jgi:hypothetical protein